MAVWTHAVDDDRIKTLRSPLYFKNTAQPEEYDDMNPFVEAVLTPRNGRAQVLVSNKEMPYLYYVMWKASA